MICRRCKKRKRLSSFNESVIKNRKFICKDCLKLARYNYKKNVNYVIIGIYNHQQHSGIKVCYSLEELGVWLTHNQKFLDLYSKWIAFDCTRSLKPIVARIDTSKPFAINNLYVTTLKNHKLEISKQRSRPVAQIDNRGHIVAKFTNARVAARMLGSKFYANIHDCCRKRRAKALGYRWQYI